MGVNKSEYVRMPGGVICVRNALSETEHRALFELGFNAVRDGEALALNNGLVVNSLFEQEPEIYSHLNSKEFRSILCSAIGVSDNELRITAHSDFHLNTLGGWHTDLDAGYCSEPEAISAKIYKVGIFRVSGLINLATKVTQFCHDGQKFVLEEFYDTDILLFPVGIRHRGYPGTVLLNLFRRIGNLFPFNTTLQFNSLRSLGAEPDRQAIFFTIGRTSKELDCFESANMVRAEAQIRLARPQSSDR